jgi:hypothetical protein
VHESAKGFDDSSLSPSIYVLREKLRNDVGSKCVHIPVDHEWSILTPISLRVVYSDVNNQGLSFAVVRMEAKRI